LRQLSKRKKSTNQSSIIELSKAFQKLYFDIFCPIILVADFDGDKCGLLEAYTYKSNEMILRTRLWLGVLLVALLLSPTVSAEDEDYGGEMVGSSLGGSDDIYDPAQLDAEVEDYLFSLHATNAVNFRHNGSLKKRSTC